MSKTVRKTMDMSAVKKRHKVTSQYLGVKKRKKPQKKELEEEDPILLEVTSLT